MDSEVLAAGRLNWAIAARIAMLCVLSIAIAQLLATTRFYATALILVGLFAITANDLRRLLVRTKRDASRGMDEAAARRSHDQHKREQQLQHAEALLDTVTAALFVVREDGTAMPANRPARRLAGESIVTLHEIAALGTTTAALLQAMQPGARHVAYLADGQPVYVSATEFRGGTGRQRLISIQRIAGELDAVELKAWQDVASVLTHEMMNSLTPIASLSENLEQLLRAAQPSGSMDATSVELSGALEAIKRRSQGLMSFVERYRAVAELPEPNLRVVDLEQLFAGVDRLMSPMLREAGVTYRRNIELPMPSLLVDAGLLEQAIINLISNAADAAAADTAVGKTHPLAPSRVREGEIGFDFFVVPEGRKMESDFSLRNPAGRQRQGLTVTTACEPDSQLADPRPPGRFSPEKENIGNDFSLSYTREGRTAERVAEAADRPLDERPQVMSSPEKKNMKKDFSVSGTRERRGLGLLAEAANRAPDHGSQGTSFPEEKNTKDNVPRPHAGGGQGVGLPTEAANLPPDQEPWASFPEKKNIRNDFPLPATGGGQGVGLLRGEAKVEPTVTITCKIHDGEVVIAIADNGIGLSEQQRERIFVPFYTTKPNGSGIGLSLARQIAFAHGGRIEVQSNEPTGSVFSIILPAATRTPN